MCEILITHDSVSTAGCECLEEALKELAGMDDVS
jgi:hypothetical protein